ncbi:MAG: FtsX-like permease family protein [Clostridia bacterium]|nr:FtsX-like permease family protein [Clostridia bacterium]
MKINDYIYLASVNLKRRRKSFVVNVILISISLFILICCLSFSNSLSKAMNRALINNISYRSISAMSNKSIKTEELVDMVGSVEHVIKVVPQMKYETALEVSALDNENFSGNITVYGGNEEIYPNIIAGRSFYDDEKNVCIVPKEFYLFDMNKYDKEKSIDGESLIGKSIEITYYSYEYIENSAPIKKDKYTKTLKVIGVYDQDENMMNVNECYINFSDISDIMDIRLEGNNYSGIDTQGVTAIVDSSLNVNQVVETLESMDLRVIVRSVVNEKLIKIINLTSIFVSSVIMIIAFINITISSIKSIEERRYEIGMLKAIGYNRKNIIGILVIENIIIGIAAFIITIIISLIAILLVREKIFSNNISLKSIGLDLNLNTSMVSLIIALVVPVLSGIICSGKITKKNSITLNKER